MRGRNNEIISQTGSVTRGGSEIERDLKRKKDMKMAAHRLKQLEKLEDYREEKMQREMEVLEQERQMEQALI